MPVEYSYTSTPLSTRTVQLYFYSPLGRTACTEPQCLYSTAIPLLSYGPYGLYRASVPVEYSYKFNPTMGRTVFTETQCLYSTAIALLPSVPVQYTYTSTALSTCTVHLYLYSPQCL